MHVDDWRQGRAALGGSRKRNHIGRQCLTLAHGLKVADPNARGGGGIEYELLTMDHACHVVHATVAGIAAFAESAKRAKRQNCCNTDGGGSTERTDRCHEGGGSPCGGGGGSSSGLGGGCGGCGAHGGGGCGANGCNLGSGGSGCHRAAQSDDGLIRQLLSDHLPNGVDHSADHALSHTLHCIANG